MKSLPNILTLTRLLILIPFGFYILNEKYVLALFCLIYAGLSDWLDGKIARKFDTVTKIGSLLDPITDRIYMILVPVLFAFSNLLPWYIFIIFFLREFILFISYIFLNINKVSPNEVIYLGKVATFVLMLSFPTILLGELDFLLNSFFKNLSVALIIWGIYFSYLSMFVYLSKTIKIIKSTNKLKN